MKTSRILYRCVFPVFIFLILTSCSLTDDEKSQPVKKAQNEMPSGAPGLTEEAVMELVERMDDATTYMDTIVLSECLAPSAVFTFKFRGQSKKMKAGAYLETLETGWEKCEDFQYERENQVIRLGKDGKSAVVEADVTEAYVIRGKETTSRSHEKVTMKLIDGELLVVKASAVMN